MRQLEKEVHLAIESATLRYFRVVAECGSIKQAAAALRVAPSAISRQMQGLENELSVKLFKRGARGMSLTDAGHMLYRYAVENRQQLDSLRSRVGEFASLRRGHVKIATVEGLLVRFLSDFVVDLSRDHPGISISMTAVGSRDVADMVGQSDVDLGLVFGRAPRRDLIELAHMRQSLCLIVSSTHRLARRESCSVGELAGLRVVAPDSSFGIRQEIDKACARARVPLDIHHETNSLAFAQAVVASSDLGTFLPRSTALPLIQAGALVAIALRDKGLEATQTTLVQSSVQRISPAAKLVADLIVARMEAEGSG